MPVEDFAWDRLPNESPKAYERFQHYLEVQNYKAVSERFGIDYSAIRDQAVRYKWRERTTAYNEYRRKNRLEVRSVDLTTAQQTAVNEELIIAAGMMQQVVRALNDAKRNGIDVKDLKTLVDTFNTLTDIQRRALGLPVKVASTTNKTPLKDTGSETGVNMFVLPDINEELSNYGEYPTEEFEGE